MDSNGTDKTARGAAGGIPPLTREEHFSYGKVYFDQKEYAHAIEEYKLAYDENSLSSNVHIGMGRCHFALGQFEEARVCFEKAVERTPDFADAHYYLGQACLELGKRDSAINEFKEALNINSRYKAARAALGKLLKAFGHKHAQPLPAPEPENPQEEEDGISRQANIHYHLGNALFQKNLLQEALAEFKEAIRLRPNYPDIRSRLGELYMKRGLYNLAEEEFKLALKINPRYLVATLNLAECYRQHSEHLLEKAGDMYGRAVELAPENNQARRGLDKIKNIKEIHFS